MNCSANRKSITSNKSPGANPPFLLEAKSVETKFLGGGGEKEEEEEQEESFLGLRSESS